LFGSFNSVGVSFEWHDFHRPDPTDWAASFHPGGVEICLNLEGHGELSSGSHDVTLPPRSLVFYRQGTPPLSAVRRGGDCHRFVTVEFSPCFLEQQIPSGFDSLHPVVSRVLEDPGGASLVASVEPIGAPMLQLVESLRHCPVFKPAQELWFKSKALEFIALVFLRPTETELFCTRQQRAARERVARIRSVLAGRLEDPPSLGELGRLVGCSPFHLSRQFSQETGSTIQQCLREMRLERAAELLRSGECNVTEAAMRVGYSSLSHFTVAFREVYGCCPGLYPMKAVIPRRTGR
jgi:AraC-like DNA-binding protein